MLPGNSWARALGLQRPDPGCLGGSAPLGAHPFSPGDGALHKSCREGRHERAGRRAASECRPAAAEHEPRGRRPHAADLEDTSTAWCRCPELALPDLLLLKPAAPFLARLRDTCADTCF